METRFANLERTIKRAQAQAGMVGPNRATAPGGRPYGIPRGGSADGIPGHPEKTFGLNHPHLHLPKRGICIMHALELLAPAGSWDCAKAAVENGADAIYFGTESFNARMRADNFRLADLPELMAWLHGRGVRGYLTFNTLVFASEMHEAERFLRAGIAAGLDAAIVQDVGICRLIREISPDFPIHASTQMTVASAAGARYVQELGCSTVVLARENTLAEMARIQQDLEDDPVALEVFVHGALCVAYSGQCLTSEALGGRSANRGLCAQACQIPYDLISEDRKVPLRDKRYLLSPQDLSG